VAIDADIHRFHRHARQFGADVDFLVALVDIDARRGHRGLIVGPAAEAAKEIAEPPVHFPLQIRERIAPARRNAARSNGSSKTGHGHGTPPWWKGGHEPHRALT